MIILITYDFFIQKNICMHLFIYLSSLWYQDSCIMLNLLTMPPKNMQFQLHFNEKRILIIMRVMSLTLIHIYSHMHIDTWTPQQREWFSSWPCGCKNESWSPVTHIDWRSCFGGRLSPFPLLSCLPRLPLAFYFLHLSAEISAVIRDWDWWQSQHAPCYII